MIKYNFIGEPSHLKNGVHFQFQKFVAYTGNNMRKEPTSPEKNRGEVSLFST